MRSNENPKSKQNLCCMCDFLVSLLVFPSPSTPTVAFSKHHGRLSPKVCHATYPVSRQKPPAYLQDSLLCIKLHRVKILTHCIDANGHKTSFIFIFVHHLKSVQLHANRSNISFLCMGFVFLCSVGNSPPL